ncbi:MAG: hypothetical protein IAF94_25080 [Pirellulaceae bacterium]|nr:hypothetical protein [Pirellulaceae bacterium]
MDLVYYPIAMFQGYLLASFVLGLLLSAKCLVQMAFPQIRAPRWVEAIACLAAFAMAFVLSLDALGNGGGLVALAPPLLALTALGTSLILVASHLGVSLLRSRPRQLALQPVAWVAVALTLVATGWSSHRYSAGKIQAEIERFEHFSNSGDLEPVLNSVGVTDRGREVQLYRWQPEDGFGVSIPIPYQTSAEDGRANCHGWVFTGGEHLLWRDGVERILEDNGYQPCQAPRPGDLIIYRSASGEVVHTGLVKTKLFGGRMMIESKWGLGGRFVHRPAEQPYGDNFSYYRSARQGHALAIRPATLALKIASR